MAEVFGIDVSHHNGKILWDQVARHKQFAIMKAQYEAASHNIDETFEYNYTEAGKYGLARGVYIYIARASVADPVADATALIKKLKGRPLEYGIWLDLEDKSIQYLGKDGLERLAYIYANLFRAAGYYVGIYCNKDWYDRLMSDKLKYSFDFWIARYPRDDKGTYNPTSSLKPANIGVAWQYSSKGNVPGIKSRVDLNVDFDGVVNLMANQDGTAYRKSNREIALEVLDNKWGTASTSPTREEMITAAGYNYEEIRKIVNQLYHSKAR